MCSRNSLFLIQPLTTRGQANRRRNADKRWFWLSGFYTQEQRDQHRFWRVFNPHAWIQRENLHGNMLQQRVGVLLTEAGGHQKVKKRSDSWTAITAGQFWTWTSSAEVLLLHSCSIFLPKSSLLFLNAAQWRARLHVCSEIMFCTQKQKEHTCKTGWTVSTFVEFLLTICFVKRVN